MAHVAQPQKMCEVCKESAATVHLTEMSNQHVVLERHLCDVCAAKQGLIGKIQVSLVSELLGSLKEKGKGASAKDADLKCPDCGITYAEFRAKARFGCARDYDVFRKHVVGLLEKIHGATEHVGKRPKGAIKAPPPAAPAPPPPAPPPPAKAHKTPAPSLAELEKELEKLVKAEEYEKAARLRDRIRDMKPKKEGS